MASHSKFLCCRGRSIQNPLTLGIPGWCIVSRPARNAPRADGRDGKTPAEQLNERLGIEGRWVGAWTDPNQHWEKKALSKIISNYIVKMEGICGANLCLWLVFSRFGDLVDRVALSNVSWSCDNCDVPRKILAVREDLRLPCEILWAWTKMFCNCPLAKW